MKNIATIILILLSSISFAQSINQFEYVMIPTQFEFQKTENQYRLNTLVKFRLEQYGFKAFYTSSQVNTNFEDRCRYLNVNVVDDSGMLVTKLFIEFKDCENKVVFTSITGKSRNKDRQESYSEAMEEALLSVKALNYKFVSNKTEQDASIEKIIPSAPSEIKEIVTDNALFAQQIMNGFQLVDKTPRVILKMYKTSVNDSFIAISEGKNGIVIKKNNEWFFEFYREEKLISEKLNIKF